MTRRELWVIFMHGALSEGADAHEAAKAADDSLAEYQHRFYFDKEEDRDAE